MNYTIDYFIEKFENIRENKWWQNEYVSMDGFAMCAMGHCGVRSIDGISAMSSEAYALMGICTKYAEMSTHRINDGYHPNYQQETPKQRVLAALYDAKQMSALKEAEQILATECVLV